MKLFFLNIIYNLYFYSFCVIMILFRELSWKDFKDVMEGDDEFYGVQ